MGTCRGPSDGSVHALRSIVRSFPSDWQLLQIRNNLGHGPQWPSNLPAHTALAPHRDPPPSSLTVRWQILKNPHKTGSFTHCLHFLPTASFKGSPNGLVSFQGRLPIPWLCMTRRFHNLCIIHRAANVLSGFFHLPSWSTSTLAASH